MPLWSHLVGEDFQGLKIVVASPTLGGGSKPEVAILSRMYVHYVIM